MHITHSLTFINTLRFNVRCEPTVHPHQCTKKNTHSHTNAMLPPLIAEMKSPNSTFFCRKEMVSSDGQINSRLVPS